MLACSAFMLTASRSPAMHVFNNMHHHAFLFLGQSITPQALPPTPTHPAHTDTLLLPPTPTHPAHTDTLLLPPTPTHPAHTDTLLLPPTPTHPADTDITPQALPPTPTHPADTDILLKSPDYKGVFFVQ